MILLDGQRAAGHLKQKLLDRRTLLKAQDITPGLAVICVGNHPASRVYIERKKKIAADFSFDFKEFFLPENTSSSALQEVICSLNSCLQTHGILLQLPLPAHLPPAPFLAAIHPDKDVDGLSIVNLGKLFSGQKDGFVPCTPLGCLHLVQHFGFSLARKRAVVVGRSILVGRPLGALLLQQDATVTWAHAQTQHLETVTQEADFLFVAAGVPGLIQKKHVKKGACVVDVGITWVENAAGKNLQGDVDFKSVQPVAGAISPVPGGVGPMTVMALMHNTLKAAFHAHALPF
jgi:methylenetetrahydrofolate dehydrogenase (NADP+)/methenyltetrahydrofolate cyclohydrolase